MDTPKQYWKSLEERDGAADFREQGGNEFPPPSPGTPLARRDFLKAAGFTMALAGATGCSRIPVQKAIPLLVQPEEFVAGRSLYYATTCGGCAAGCGVLAKARDGRPIKLEGNPQHQLSRGGLCAVGQASLLGLYDSQRLQHPLLHGKRAEWAEVDREVTSRLQPLRSQPGAVRFLTGTVNSPTLRAAIGEFLKPYPESRHVEYDPLSRSAILDAHERTHGARLLPRYRFERADVIVSFDADFLGTWISPVEYTEAYRSGRDLEATPPRMSYHAQLEARMSITGSKADRRYAVAPADMAAAIAGLAARVAVLAKADFKGEAPASLPVPPAVLDDLAARLWKARGRSLVVSGSNDVAEQVLVNYINHLLENYGSTLDIEHPSQQAQGSDRELLQLISELREGRVKALFVYGVNPAFDLPGMEALLRSVPFLVSFAERQEETGALAQVVAAGHHFLESWSDAEPVSGSISVTQPAIRPLFNTRPALETLAAWSGQPGSAYDLLRAHWNAAIYPRRLRDTTFDAFWDAAVQEGYVEIKAEAARAAAFNTSAVAAPPAGSAPGSSFSLVLYAKAGMLDGRHAYNPWLHELPDPVTKVTWDNCACLSPAAGQRLNLSQGDVARIEATGAPSLDLPVYIQPGQHDSVVAVALGYGSALSARFAGIGPQWIDALPSTGDNGRVGSNAAPLLRFAEEHLQSWRPAVRISKTGKQRELACTQIYNTLTVPQKLAPPDGKRRPIVQETTFEAFQSDPRSGVFDVEEKTDLWPADHPYPNLRWGMVVDLNACTGCSACVIACQAENNIAIVGRDEIRRNREMHWLRIDRYYSEPEPGVVEVAHQPMMCQQCENAPCETVCPVLATVHSEDGLNTQVYNRCVGTRYCANNCPYKARRFNWFNYSHNDQLQNLVLNPDVAVRSRGVMEKCSFCLQRLQEAKIEAKRRGIPVEDGAAQTACQQSCPARAIYFGNLNDPNSQVNKMMNNPRRYRVLSELNVRPSVGYLTVVRNRPAGSKEEQHG